LCCRRAHDQLHRRALAERPDMTKDAVTPHESGGRYMPKLRTVLIALAAILALFASPARADEGTVTIQFYKAGWVIGGSFGKGVLSFRGEMYGLSVGGLSYGLTFGGSQTTLHGRVRNIRRASDVEGVYGAGSAGAAIIKGAQAVVLTNQKGAVLELTGTQTGLILNLDLSGLALTIQ
jgi:hypothetical protein